MNKETWQDYYEAALEDGFGMFEAAAFADAAVRSDMEDAIDAAEYQLEDR